MPSVTFTSENQALDYITENANRLGLGIVNTNTPEDLDFLVGQVTDEDFTRAVEFLRSNRAGGVTTPSPVATPMAVRLVSKVTDAPPHRLGGSASFPPDTLQDPLLQNSLQDPLQDPLRTRRPTHATPRHSAHHPAHPSAHQRHRPSAHSPGELFLIGACATSSMPLVGMISPALRDEVLGGFQPSGVEDVLSGFPHVRATMGDYAGLDRTDRRAVEEALKARHMDNILSSRERILPRLSQMQNEKLLRLINSGASGKAITQFLDRKEASSLSIDLLLSPGVDMRLFNEDMLLTLRGGALRRVVDSLTKGEDLHVVREHVANGNKGWVIHRLRNDMEYTSLFRSHRREVHRLRGLHVEHLAGLVREEASRGKVGHFLRHPHAIPRGAPITNYSFFAPGQVMSSPVAALVQGFVP